MLQWQGQLAQTVREVPGFLEPVTVKEKEALFSMVAEARPPRSPRKRPLRSGKSIKIHGNLWLSLDFPFKNGRFRASTRGLSARFQVLQGLWQQLEALELSKINGPLATIHVASRWRTVASPPSLEARLLRLAALVDVALLSTMIQDFFSRLLNALGPGFLAASHENGL